MIDDTFARYLADDHALVRAGFRALLKEIGCQIVAEASNGHEAVQLVAQHDPDLELMDIVMPHLDGLEATAQISRAYPHVRVVIVSMYASGEYVRRAMQAGAAGYLLKDAVVAELETALTVAAQGDVYLSPGVAKFVAADYARISPEGSRSQERLTLRQLEVLRLIARGYTRKQIAQQLSISVKTVDTHRVQLVRRLGVPDAAGLVHVAGRLGFITHPEATR